MKKTAKTTFFAALAGLALAGCTVQPLYAPTATATGSPMAAAAASVYVEPIKDRVGQQVRNELMFLLAGGAGEPANPAYELALTVQTVRHDALVVQTTKKDGEPSARKITVNASYVLTRTDDAKTVVGKRRAFATASYDVSRQEFANNRAERDAQNRAAKEVAEQLRGLISADLIRAGAR